LSRWFLTFVVGIVLAIIFLPTVGQHIRKTERVEWCQAFEARTDWSQDEARRYLKECDHFDMKTGTEVKGQR